MNPKKPQFLRPSENLKRKALNFEKGLGLTLSQVELDRIVEVIEDSRDSFIAQVAAKLKLIRKALEEIHPDDTREISEFLGEIRQESYAIKGLGGTYGFPLLTYVAKSLNDYVERKRSLTAKQITVVDLHVAMLYVVLSERVTRVDPELEARMLKSFQELTTKFR